MKESKTNNRQHTHLLSDGIQAGSSPRSFSCCTWISLLIVSAKQPRLSVPSPGALGTRFPVADTLEKMSASDCFLASFFGTPAVGRKERCLPYPEGKPPIGFQWRRASLLWRIPCNTQTNNLCL